MDHDRTWHPLRALIAAEPAPGVVVAGSVGITALVASGDFLTGPYLVFAAFYLLPVLAASWWLGRWAGLTVGALAAVAGVVSTALDPGEVTTAVIVWNGVFRFLTYSLVAVLAATAHDALRMADRLASVDPLTQLPNRRRFYELVEAELARARRSTRPLGLAYFDVDGLKERNDTYGHEAGDAMLVEFADIVRDTLRATDVVARLGGDEFCALLPETDLAAAEEALERVVVALRGVRALPIGVSVGLIAGVPTDHADAERLVHAADELMFQAKRSGKGHVRSRAGLG